MGVERTGGPTSDRLMAVVFKMRERWHSPFIIWMMLVALSINQYVNSLVTSSTHMKPELQWKQLLSDNYWLYIWTFPQTSNGEGNLTTKQQSHNKIPWVQIDLETVRSNDLDLRLIFDEEHKLRMCIFDAQSIGRPVSLDQLSLPRQTKTNKILLEEFEFTSGAEFREICRAFLTSDSSVRLRRLRRGSPLIMPGTRWCGHGNEATRDRMFGDELETDMCCQKHDTCFENIPSLTTKWGYYNPSPVTISNCQCDDEFLVCLENAGTETANRVGSLFFNVFNVPCFLRQKQKTCSDDTPEKSCTNWGYRDVIDLYFPQPFVSTYRVLYH
ncbi:Phospholipase A2 isozyme PA4 [Paragonimus heterotremus]|uniref:Phospholipase A2 isozyme PA4 n=1 Tax=Paragonimus heterotremus TaxID=100268 RepID=A0A8J4SVK6_9TREM|nr:Phospholipase A2 isozyme PA4 [Paragonimus heterotremus]